MPEARTGPACWLFAKLLAWGNEAYEVQVDARKRPLFAPLRGTVLEIGPGTGVNLKYLDPAVRWIGIEPNVHMHPYLRAEAERLGRTAEVHPGLASRLDVPDGSVDAVISTLVLCSVRSQAETLREILRVLRPGGTFAFIEHVAAPAGSRLHRLQRVIRPCWRWAVDGCHPDRDTASALKAAGFSEVEYDRFRLRVPVVAPHIAGTAVK
ncbi:MAG: class I SAM-dependent methyltransferase [Bacteroidota bacterium]